MRQHFWSLIVGLLTVLFFYSACDRTPTSLTEEISEERSEEGVTFIRKSNITNELDRAKSTNIGRAESPYSCLISTLNNDEAEFNYDNRAFWIHFPEAAVKEANGNKVFKAVALKDETAGSRAGHWNGMDDVVRVAQCVIPDSELAGKLLEKELKKFEKGTWLEDRRESNMVQSVTNNGEWVCTRELVIWICVMNPETGELEDCVELAGFSTCIEYTYVEEADQGGGSGFPSEDPGECDPLGIEPCLEDGGTAIPPPEPDPCVEHPLGDPERPVYCDKPCPDDNEDLKVLSETQVLENLWLESFGEIINGNLPPQDQRAEKGGWEVEKNGQQKFVFFPEETESSFCTSGTIPPPPDGAVSVIHTHPNLPGEMITATCYVEMYIELFDITDPDKKAELYENGVPPGSGTSHADLRYAESHSITAYYMDGEKIEKYYDGPTKKIVYEVEDRCGY